MAKDQKKIRLNVSAYSDEFNELKDKTGLVSNQELINSALTLLYWAVSEKEKGAKICSVIETQDTNQLKEIGLLALDRVKVKE